MTSALLAQTTSQDDDLFSGLRGFFESDNWLLIRNLTIFFLVIFWVATVFWVYKDARRRVEDPWMVAMAVVLGVVPFIGPIIYMFFRPPEYLEDVRERELEIRAIEERLGRSDIRCPVCKADVEPSFLVCPVCTTKLKQACVSCKAPLEAFWQVCPFCETTVEQPTSSIGLDTWESEPRIARRTRRRAERAE